MSLTPALPGFVQSPSRFPQDTSEIYARVAAELFRAMHGGKSPDALWSSLYAISTQYNLNAHHILSVIVDFFIVADDAETSFFVNTLRWHKNAKQKGDSIKQVSKKHAKHKKKKHKAKCDASVRSHENRFSSELVLSFLKNEIGRRLKRVSNIEALTEILSSGVGRESPLGEAERPFKAAAILVKENILEYSDILPYLGDEQFLIQSSSLYKACTKAILTVLRRKYPVNGQSPYPDYEAAFRVEESHPDYEAAARAVRPHPDCKAAIRDAYENSKTPDTQKQLVKGTLHAVFLALITKELEQDALPSVFLKHKTLSPLFALLSASVPPFGFALDAITASCRNRFLVSPKFSTLLDAAQVLGPHLGADVVLFHKACSYCAARLSHHKESVLEVLQTVILPAFSLCDDRPARHAVWDSLVNVDMRTRFQLYEQWHKSYDRVPALQMVKIIVESDTQRILHGLSDDTHNVTHRSILYQIAHSIAQNAEKAPVIVWKLLLSQTYGSLNIFAIVSVAVMMYCSPLTQDVLFSIIFDIFNDQERSRFEPSGKSLDDWFVSLSILTGTLFGASHYLQGLPLETYLEYLVKRLPTHTTDLVPLSSLLDMMSERTRDRDKDVPQAQMAALGGSYELRKEVLSPLSSAKVEYLLAELVILACPSSKFERLYTDESFRGLHWYMKNEPKPSETLSKVLLRNFIGRRLFMALYKTSLNADVPQKARPFWSSEEHKSLVFSHLLDIIKEDRQLVAILPDLNTLLREAKSRYDCLPVERIRLRSQIESHNFSFIQGFAKYFPPPKGLDLRYWALFCTLDVYDICVPENEYLNASKRILNLENSDNSSRFIAYCAAHAEKLKKSGDAHAAHVAKVLKHLPAFDLLLDRRHAEYLGKMICLRAFGSRLDARYVFCFFAHTIIDTLPLLHLILSRPLLVALFTEPQSFKHSAAYFVREIWQDVMSWPRSTSFTDQSAHGPVNREVNHKDMFFDAETGPIYTLFRPSHVLVNHLQTHIQCWEENTVSALTMMLDTPGPSVKNALLVAPVLARYVPRTLAMRRSIIEEKLIPLTKSSDKGIARLAEKLISRYNERNNEK